MLAWMIYALLVATALSAAALIAEQAAKRRLMATRWPWLVAIVASLVLPAAIATVSLRLPGFMRSSAPTTALVLRDTTSIPLAATVIDWSGTKSYTSSTRVDTMLRDIWLASSITLVFFLGSSTAWLHRRKRTWSRGYLTGVPVLVSENVGPAVVGLIRSRIVVPAWLLRESPGKQRYVMAHEQSHLQARDPLLVAGALVLVLTMPWNPLLWWQCHRLRCAIEVDCDARVLRGGGDVGEYCETLIQVGQNQSEYIGAVTAMSESRSFLEQRIKIMLSKPRKWARASAFALISVSLGMAVFAAQVTPPVAQPPVAGTVAVSPELLDAYAGFYEASDFSLITVARKGDGLTVTPIGQLAAQGTIDIFATSDNRFSLPALDATLEFVRGADRRASTLVVRVHGDNVIMEARRIDQAAADRIRDGLAARVRDQKPFPNSEKALKQMLSGSPATEGMTPLAARGAAANRESLQKLFDFLGPVQSYKFEGVADYGWDIYDIQFERGAL
ncbi:MAG: M56 family metallopeptidase, partial [Luteibacter sp.]